MVILKSRLKFNDATMKANKGFRRLIWVKITMSNVAHFIGSNGPTTGSKINHAVKESNISHNSTK